MSLSKHFALITALVAALSVQTSLAANIYAQGSFGQQMAMYVEPLLDRDATLVFSLAEDGAFFNKQVDVDALEGTPVTQDLLRYLEGNSRKHLGFNANASKAPVDVLPGNLDESVCVVIFKDVKNVTWSTLLHEAMHCKTAHYYRDRAFLSILAPFYTKLDRFAPDAFRVMMDEALGAHLQVAYAANHGIEHGIDKLETLAAHTQNRRNSIGVRTARHALATCSTKGACSTDTTEMARMLMGSEDFKALLAQDMDDYAVTRPDFR